MFGNFFAASKLQGGPGFPVLLPVLYDYMAYYDGVEVSDLPNYQVKNLLGEVSVLSV